MPKRRVPLVFRALAPTLASCLVAWVLEGAALAQPMPSGSRIRDLAGPVWFGLRSDRNAPAIDSTIVGRECNAVQFTHYPAWGGWPKRGDYGLSTISANIDHFSALGLPMVMHMFVGPNLYLPDWFKNGTWDTATLDTLLGELITTTIQSGDPNSRVNVWNVVNEAVSWDGTGWEASKFLELGYEADASGLTGSDRVFNTIPIYVRRAFEYARLGTSRELELRDYDNDGLETRWGQGEKKVKAFYQLVRHLQAKGTPLDAVGMQGHFNIDIKVTFSRLTEQVKRYRALGLKVYITEMDAQQNEHSKTWDATIAERQGEYFYEYVKAALAGGVNGIFAWGVRDNQDQGWLLGENALLFTEDGSPKPAYYGVQRAFQEAGLPIGTGGANGTGGTGVGGTGGTDGTDVGGTGGATTGGDSAGGTTTNGGAPGTGGDEWSDYGQGSSSGCGCSVPRSSRFAQSSWVLLLLAALRRRRGQ